MKKLLLATATALAGIAAGGAQAATDLTGDTIIGAYDFNHESLFGDYSYTVNPFIVGPGVQSVLTIDGFATTNVEFSAHGLVLMITRDVTYSAPVLYDGPKFSVVSGNPFGTIESVIASGGQSVEASVVGGALVVNWTGQFFHAGDTVAVNFARASAAAPEPSAWAMMLLGFAGLGLAGYRRAKSARAA